VIPAQKPSEPILGRHFCFYDSTSFRSMRPRRHLDLLLAVLALLAFNQQALSTDDLAAAQAGGLPADIATLDPSVGGTAFSTSTSALSELKTIRVMAVESARVAQMNAYVGAVSCGLLLALCFLLRLKIWV